MKNVIHYQKSNIVIVKTDHYNVIFKYYNGNTILVDELVTCEDFRLFVTISSTRIVNFVSPTSKTNTKNYFIDLHNNICLYKNGIFTLHEAIHFYVIAGNIRIEKIKCSLGVKMKNMYIFKKNNIIIYQYNHSVILKYNESFLEQLQKRN